MQQASSDHMGRRRCSGRVRTASLLRNATMKTRAHLPSRNHFRLPSGLDEVGRPVDHVVEVDRSDPGASASVAFEDRSEDGLECDGRLPARSRSYVVVAAHIWTHEPCHSMPSPRLGWRSEPVDRGKPERRSRRSIRLVGPIGDCLASIHQIVEWLDIIKKQSVRRRPCARSRLPGQLEKGLSERARDRRRLPLRSPPSCPTRPSRERCRLCAPLRQRRSLDSLPRNRHGRSRQGERDRTSAGRTARRADEAGGSTRMRR